MDPRLEKILKLPTYQKGLILALIMLSVVGLFIYFLYIPLQEDYEDLEKQNRSLQSKLQEDQRIADNLPTFRAEFEKMEALLESALKELPNKRISFYDIDSRPIEKILTEKEKAMYLDEIKKDIAYFGLTNSKAHLIVDISDLGLNDSAVKVQESIIQLKKRES